MKDHKGLIYLLQSNKAEQSNNKRVTRAILSFLMPACSSIFGLASVDQIKAIQDNLMILQNNREGLSNDTEKIYAKLATMSNVTSQRIDLIWDALSKQDSNINATLEAFKSLSQDVSQTNLSKATCLRKLLTLLRLKRHWTKER